MITEVKLNESELKLALSEYIEKYSDWYAIDYVWGMMSVSAKIDEDNRVDELTMKFENAVVKNEML